MAGRTGIARRSNIRIKHALLKFKKMILLRRQIEKSDRLMTEGTRVLLRVPGHLGNEAESLVLRVKELERRKGRELSEKELAYFRSIAKDIEKRNVALDRRLKDQLIKIDKKRERKQKQLETLMGFRKRKKV